MNAGEAVLFVSNGHGEVAISDRIAAELPSTIACDHLALVGALRDGSGEPGSPRMREVGPRRSMPSGGLIAMGNVRNILRDVRAGLVGHTIAQARFLRAVAHTYRVVVAVGDVFALYMAFRARAAATIFVGTAKSVYVAPYGALEERVMARARAVFVRDAPTAQSLHDHGIAAQAANVIVDLNKPGLPAAGDAAFEPCLAIFPGSRESAYEDAIRLCSVVRELAGSKQRLGALLSVAPGLDAARMALGLQRDGWHVEPRDDPQTPYAFSIDGREVVRAWRGSIGAMLAGTAVVLGQAGTANEAAAAAGIPVVAFEHSQMHAWYRKRQIGLLDGALLVVHGDAHAAAGAVEQLLDDPNRREQMGRIGRERMGPPGGAAEIAREIARLCA